jgi:hypothetical protein
MFTPEQGKYLTRHLARNDVVLFLGAGFSRDLPARSGKPIPDGWGLARGLWERYFPAEPYENASLDIVFSAALGSGKPHAALQSYLEETLLASSVPPAYTAITAPFWYRIYTINVDNVAELAYQHPGAQRLTVLSHPDDEISDRDQSLASVQLVHLNGRLPCSPTRVNFTPYQFAKTAIRRPALWETFVRDYATHPVLFLGTSLQEPLFWTALAAREARAAGIKELRPESFLVTPSISAAHITHLRSFNVTHVAGTTAELLAWLEEAKPTLLPVREVLRQTNPGLTALIETAEHDALAISAAAIRQFGAVFQPVPTGPPVPGKSHYLLGAAPRWNDILLDLDAARTCTNDLTAYADEALADTGLKVGLILGSAGSGKSTILRRLGLTLARQGKGVFLTNSEMIPGIDEVRKVLAGLGARSVLLFDNAEVALSHLPPLLDGIRDLDNPPVVFIASRTNDFDRLWRKLSGETEVKEFHVRNLQRAEIIGVIDTLERNGLLGKLQGLNVAARIREFEVRAKKQLLVAMREATEGPGFDEIIRTEFRSLEPPESMSLYLCVALATDAGYRLTEEEVIGCSMVPPAETLSIIRRSLRDVVVPSGVSENLLMLRHQLIAEMIVEKEARRDELKEAYVRLLSSLSIGLRGAHWRSRPAGIFKRVLDHRTIYRRFSSDLSEAREIFESVRPSLAQQSHFWLQYGSLELEGSGGNLDFARNYLLQAESLQPQDPFVQNALGHLFLRQAIAAASFTEATDLKGRGEAILLRQMENSGYEDPYAVHIYGTQMLKWLRRWVPNKARRAKEMELLIAVAKEGARIHPRHERLRTLRRSLEREYLSLAIKGHQ